MPKYEIWSEGYVATGERANAHFHGHSTGDTFTEACSNFARCKPEFAAYFAEDTLTFWGCRLFDNEADARRSFG